MAFQHSNNVVPLGKINLAVIRHSIAEGPVTLYTRVSNSNCSKGQMRTYKVTRGPHYDADETLLVQEPYWKQLLHLISCERYHQL